jgi:predicted nucleic acid-binding protein
VTAVFLDTVGLLALWDTADQWHANAEAAFNRLKAQRVPFVTTSFVLLECGNAAARRPYRDEADHLRGLLESRGELITPTADDWLLAWESYRRGEAGDAGIVDCTSFVIMRRLNLTEAFTNDHHFAAAGMTTLF